MNELYKEAGNEFAQNNTQCSKLQSLVQLDDSNRPKPNLLRINADNQDKKFLCIFWSIFLVFVIALAIISKLLPSAIKMITLEKELKGTYLENCWNPNTFENDILQCGAFSSTNPTVSIVTQKLSSMNQFAAFWLYITPISANPSLSFNQSVTYLMYGLDNVNSDNQNSFKKGNLYENETVGFYYTSDNMSYVYGDDGTFQGYGVFLGFIESFPADNIYFGLQFNGNFTDFDSVGDIQIQGYKISKNFTVFTFVIRYVFFVLSLLAAFLYIRRYRKIPADDRIIEQKLIGILSVLLIFFNDPFYPITVLKENMVRQFIVKNSSFFSTLFVISFIVYLIFIWAIFYDRIYFQEGRKDTEQIKLYKIIAAVILFILLMILYMFYAAYRLNDHPIIPREKLNDNSISVLNVLTFIWFAFIMLNIIYRYISICCDKDERLWRNDLFMSYSLLFMLAMMVFIFTNNALGAFEYNGTTVIFLYGLMNFYVWYLQYMYSPTKQTAEELGEKRTLNSDQMMSMGTVEFNDLNINLDDNGPFYSLPTKQKQQISNNKDKDIGNHKWNKDYQYEEKPRKFSSEGSQDESSAYYQKNQIVQNNNVIKPHETDFFNERKDESPKSKMQSPQIHEVFKNNNPNLFFSSNNNSKATQNQQEFYQPHFSSQNNQFEEIDQKNLQVMSEYDSQKPNDDHVDQQQNHHEAQTLHQEEGFGDFELE